MKGAKPPYGDWLCQLRLSPQNVSCYQSSACAHRAPIIKPPSERSQNPKTWGNWERIGDFCLQKCQRGRQLSPLSEATRLDRNSLRSFRKSVKKGQSPLRRLALPISPIPLQNGSFLQSCTRAFSSRHLPETVFGRGLAISARRNAKVGGCEPAFKFRASLKIKDSEINRILCFLRTGEWAKPNHLQFLLLATASIGSL